jgi:hypothetical protein
MAAVVVEHSGFLEHIAADPATNTVITAPGASAYAPAQLSAVG